jgi:hypothetical protein
MGSVNHPRIFDAATMATIKAAFHDVWDTIDGQDLLPSDEDLKAAIIRRLIDLVGEGTTRREDLRMRVLGDLPLG